MLNNSVIKTKEKWKKRKRLQVKNLKSRSKCMHDTHITKEESTNTSQYGERRYGEEKQKIVVRLFCIDSCSDFSATKSSKFDFTLFCPKMPSKPDLFFIFPPVMVPKIDVFFSDGVPCGVPGFMLPTTQQKYL